MIANLNYVHILVATLAYFAIGAIWYSLLFGKPWMKAANIAPPSPEDRKRMPMMFASTFVLNFITTFATACVLYFVQPVSVVAALKVGLLLSVGFVGANTALNNMYVRRPFALTLIDSGYHVIAICTVSVILMCWGW
jgi:hypothetical protein